MSSNFNCKPCILGVACHNHLPFWSLVFSLGGNHTATQSSFATPCSNFTNSDGSPGVDSGFQFVNTSTGMIPTWSITINNVSAPLWFYCRQTGYGLILLLWVYCIAYGA